RALTRSPPPTTARPNSTCACTTTRMPRTASIAARRWASRRCCWPSRSSSPSAMRWQRRAADCGRRRRACRPRPRTCSRRSTRCGATRGRAAMASQVLDEREDVALGVLEPRGLGAAGGDDVAAFGGTGHVVVLERHAAALELGDLALDVFDAPEHLAGL